jgi:MFS family permease
VSADATLVPIEPASAGARPVALLAERDFLRLWLGQAVSQIGDGITALVLAVLVYRQTGSAAAVAALAVVTSAPQVLLGLHAGVFADRWDRRRVMIASDLLRAAVVVLLALAIARERVAWSLALACAHAAIGVFFEPARTAFLPWVVPRERLLAANGLTASTRMTCGVAGTVLAGVLLASVHGTAIALGVDALTFLISAAAVASISVPRGPSRGAGANSSRESPVDASSNDESTRGPRRGITAELIEGLDIVFHHPMLSSLLLTFAVTVLGMGAVGVLFVPFLLGDLHAPTAAIGFVRGVQLAGMIGGGLLLARRGSGIPAGRVLAAGILGLGPLLIFIGFAPHWAALFPLIALAGLCSSAVQSGSTTLIQQAVPDRLRGRAESALDTILVLVTIVSIAAAGAFADRVGVRLVFVIAGGLVLLGAWIGGARLVAARDAAEGVEVKLET